MRTEGAASAGVAPAAVSLEAVSYTYPDGHAALLEVSLAVQEGACYGLLGANGAGKSTLLLQLNGLLRGSGAVRIGGMLVEPANFPEIRRRVGLVFQDPDDQLFMASVSEDVAFGPRCTGLSEREVETRVQDALLQVGMSHAAGRPPHHLSVGEKKRVALAGVLAGGCRVLVLDEPTAGLDPRGRRELADLLGKMDQTRLLSTHDLEFAATMCDRVAVLSGGKLAAEGPARELLSNADLMEASGLEVPASLRRM
jgi:cobalt/nickel transport system ATP-binding protein